MLFGHLFLLPFPRNQMSGCLKQMVIHFSIVKWTLMKQITGSLWKNNQTYLSLGRLSSLACSQTIHCPTENGKHKHPSIRCFNLIKTVFVLKTIAVVFL